MGRIPKIYKNNKEYDRYVKQLTKKYIDGKPACSICGGRIYSPRALNLGIGIKCENKLRKKIKIEQLLKFKQDQNKFDFFSNKEELNGRINKFGQ